MTEYFDIEDTLFLFFNKSGSYFLYVLKDNTITSVSLGNYNNNDRLYLLCY